MGIIAIRSQFHDVFLILNIKESIRIHDRFPTLGYSGQPGDGSFSHKNMVTFWVFSYFECFPPLGYSGLLWAAGRRKFLPNKHGNILSVFLL